MANVTQALTGQELDTSQGVPNTGLRMKGTLPMLEVQADFTYDHKLDFNIILPKLRVHAYGGMIFDLTLPSLDAATQITIPNVLRVAARLPDLQVGWIGSVGFVWQIRIELPLLTTKARMGGWRIVGQLPMLQATGTGAMHLLTSTSLSWNITLPALDASAGLSTRVAGYSFYVLLPALVATKHLSGSVLLPALRASARISRSQTTELRRGWAMNLQNNAVTEFNGFDFRAMGYAYNDHYGVGFDGSLYRMGGDNDAGQPISWAWESGLADFGMNAQKGLLALYIDGHFANSAVFTIQADTARRTYGHRAKGNIYNHQMHRVPLGKGVRTHSIGIGMADVDGGYLELDKITPEYVITQRNL